MIGIHTHSTDGRTSFPRAHEVSLAIAECPPSVETPATETQMRLGTSESTSTLTSLFDGHESQLTNGNWKISQPQLKYEYQQDLIPPPAKAPFPTARILPSHSDGSHTSAAATEFAVEFVVMFSWTRQNDGRATVLMD